MRVALFFVLPVLLWPAQEAPPAFRSSVRLVMVDVLAREMPNGRVIDLLGPQDFIVLDEGEKRDIKSFQIETAPLDIVFAMYTKGAIQAGNDAIQIVTALRDAIHELRPEDRAAVIRGDSAGKTGVTLTADHQELESQLALPRNRVSSGRGDRLYDAVHAAVELFPKPYDAARRRAIVAVIDDIERGSKTTLAALENALLEADATLNAAMLVTWQPHATVGGGTPLPIPGLPRTATRRIGGTTPEGDSIQPAVDATGGETIAGDQVRSEFPEMLRRLRARYLLGFYAQPARERVFRRIEVRLTGDARKRYPNAAIRARKGYFTEPASP